jgi:hypothetical protein
MKMILVIGMGVLLFGAAIGPIDWTNPAAQPGDAARRRAEREMTLVYGKNWYEIFLGCVKSNRALSKSMTATYESAVGYHHPK